MQEKNEGALRGNEDQENIGKRGKQEVRERVVRRHDEVWAAGDGKEAGESLLGIFRFRRRRRVFGGASVLPTGWRTGA